MKNACKSLLARLGYSITCGYRAVLGSAEARFRPRLDHALALEYLATGRDFFFLQIGAFDGGTGDPVWEFVTRHPCSGILVEPQPDVYRELERNASPYPGFRCVNAAVGIQRGTTRLFRVGNAPGIPDWARQLASMDRDHLLRHRNAIPDIEQRIEVLEVPTLRFDDLLDDAPPSGISLLHIDAEGYDGELLKAFPFERAHPRIIHFEMKHLPDAEKEATLRLLIERGYAIHAPYLEENAFAVLSR